MLSYFHLDARLCYYFRTNDKPLISRKLYPKVLEALADSPAVLIHGPRQCGKTTSAQMAGAGNGYAYYTFDDDFQRESAIGDPFGYVRSLPEKIVLDEIQRVPHIITSLKNAIDSVRKPGRC